MPQPQPTKASSRPRSPAEQVADEIDRAVSVADLDVCMSKAAALADCAEGHRLGEEILCLLAEWSAAGTGWAKQARNIVRRYERMPKLYG